MKLCIEPHQNPLYVRCTVFACKKLYRLLCLHNVTFTDPIFSYALVAFKKFIVIYEIYK